MHTTHHKGSDITTNQVNMRKLGPPKPSARHRLQWPGRITRRSSAASAAAVLAPVTVAPQSQQVEAT